MTQPQSEHVEIVQGDLDDHDPADLEQLRAYRMMPRWGQVLAWFVWELPALWYASVTGGALWIFYSDRPAWKVSVVVVAFLFAFGAHARKRVRSPFRHFVLVTRKPVPGAVADAAQAGPMRGGS